MEAAVQRSVKSFVVQARDDFRVFEVGVLLEQLLEVEGDL